MKRKTKRPNLYVFAGPNGAGKTTFAREFLPHYVKCLEFVNADLIAQGLSPFAPDRAAIRAGRLMLERIHSLSKEGKDFGFETTLSGRSYAPLLRELRKQGYFIHLFFLWVRSVELAMERIADRVRRGGHDVPGEIVRRRFKRGIMNLFRIYRPLLDSLVLFDNSSDYPRVITVERSGKLEITDSDLYEKLKRDMEIP